MESFDIIDDSEETSFETLDTYDDYIEENNYDTDEETIKFVSNMVYEFQSEMNEIKLNPSTFDNKIFDEYSTMIADYDFIIKQDRILKSQVALLKMDIDECERKCSEIMIKEIMDADNLRIVPETTNSISRYNRGGIIVQDDLRLSYLQFGSESITQFKSGKDTDLLSRPNYGKRETNGLIQNLNYKEMMKSTKEQLEHLRSEERELKDQISENNNKSVQYNYARIALKRIIDLIETDLLYTKKDISYDFHLVLFKYTDVIETYIVLKKLADIINLKLCDMDSNVFDSDCILPINTKSIIENTDDLIFNKESDILDEIKIHNEDGSIMQIIGDKNIESYLKQISTDNISRNIEQT